MKELETRLYNLHEKFIQTKSVDPIQIKAVNNDN